MDFLANEMACGLHARTLHDGLKQQGVDGLPARKWDEDREFPVQVGGGHEVSEEIIKKIQEIICKQLETLRKLLRVDHREDIQEFIGERLLAAQRHRAEIEVRAIERENNILTKIIQGQKLHAEQIIAATQVKLQRASEEREQQHKYLRTQLGALRGSMNRMKDKMRAMKAHMRGTNELLTTQQQQMSEMTQKIALLEAKTNNTIVK